MQPSFVLQTRRKIHPRGSSGTKAETLDGTRKPGDKSTSLTPTTTLFSHTRLLPLRNLSRAVMDFMKAGEAMLRSSQPLLPFLAPAAYRQPPRRMAFVSRHCSAQPMQTSLTRSFATSMRNRQDAATAADPAPEHPDSPAAVKPKTSATEDISSILDSTLDGSKGTPTTPTGRSTRFASNRNQHENSRSRNMLSHTTLDDVLAGMDGPPSPTRRADVGRSLNPRAAREGPLTAPKPAPMKLGPHLGKTVHIEKNRGIDVAGAFRRLEGTLAKNYVRKDFNRQRFHERGGMKRKRLNMERWRKRFRYAFKATCRRVIQMKKQGW